MGFSRSVCLFENHCRCFLPLPAGIWAGRPEWTDGQSRGTDEAAERYHRLSVLTSGTNRRKLWSSRGPARHEPGHPPVTFQTVWRLVFSCFGLYSTHAFISKNPAMRQKENSHARLERSGFKRQLCLELILSFTNVFVFPLVSTHAAALASLNKWMEKTGFRKWHTVLSGSSLCRSVFPKTLLRFSKTHLNTALWRNKSIPGGSGNKYKKIHFIANIPPFPDQ